jgi:Holliday junction DNA helicase RuvA
MIVRMTGTVASVNKDTIVLERGGLAYEIMVPGYAIGELTARIGSEVTLHTMQYYEGNSAGGNLIPRFIGFLAPTDRAFFERFITVKGMGARKAVKALAEPIANVAQAIESGNVPLLTRLPGIGRRAADQIVAELRGKVQAFAAPSEAEAPRPSKLSPAQADALEVLVVLGERRTEAEQWLAKAIDRDPAEKPADEWVRAAYRVKTGGSR